MLDKSSKIPLSTQVKQSILNRIQSNQYKIGDMIETEVQLCEQYGVSRITVRNAIIELTREGYPELAAKPE